VGAHAAPHSSFRVVRPTRAPKPRARRVQGHNPKILKHHHDAEAAGLRLRSVSSCYKGSSGEEEKTVVFY
jgi:hypothetical protein